MSLPVDAEAIRYDKILPMVFISAPYSLPDPATNIKRVSRVASRLATSGRLFPVAPVLLCHAWEQTVGQSYEFWIEYTKRFVENTDSLLRLSGESDGADGEVELANSLGIPIFYDVDSILEWSAQ